MNQVNQAKEKLKANIDWKLVTSAVVASVVIGAGVYGLRKVGLGKVATVVKGG